MTDKAEIENKISEYVRSLGIYGNDAERLVKFATDSAWSHVEMGGDASMVLHCPETFAREGVARFDLGTVVETHDRTGNHYRFVRKGATF